MAPASSKTDEVKTAVVLSDTAILSLMRAIFTTGKRDGWLVILWIVLLLSSYSKSDYDLEAVVLPLSEPQKDLIMPWERTCPLVDSSDANDSSLNEQDNLLFIYFHYHSARSLIY